jgi:hypothetical protein
MKERKKERKKRGVRADAAYKYTTKIKIAYNIYIYISSYYLLAHHIMEQMKTYTSLHV